MCKVGEWLYFTPQEITVREIMNAIEASGTKKAEIWEDAGVLEIELNDGNTIDFEGATIHPKDIITQAFAEEKGAKTVFLVTFKPETFEAVKEVMNQIVAKTGGFFCGDTENFTPVYPEV